MQKELQAKKDHDESKSAFAKTIETLQAKVKATEKEANDNKSLLLQSNAKLKKAESSVKQMQETMDDMEQETGEQLTSLNKKAKQATEDWQKAVKRAKDAEKAKEDLEQELVQLRENAQAKELAREFEQKLKESE